jgi:hypothetical protein
MLGFDGFPALQVVVTARFGVQYGGTEKPFFGQADTCLTRP